MTDEQAIRYHEVHTGMLAKGMAAYWRWQADRVERPGHTAEDEAVANLVATVYAVMEAERRATRAPDVARSQAYRPSPSRAGKPPHRSVRRTKPAAGSV